ncbi:hypothetical protein [Paenibacillus hemerocallicola]|nr:hypothetical protein [Paenibacillus hemerocallicola]
MSFSTRQDVMAGEGEQGEGEQAEASDTTIFEGKGTKSSSIALRGVEKQA